MSTHFRIVGFGTLLAALFIALPAWLAASAENVPMAHGSIGRDYARVTFEWPRKVNFTARADGTSVAITFDHKADPDFGPLLSALSPYVVNARRKSDGKTVVLTLDKPYRIRTFVSDTINGIDLLDINKKESRAAVRLARNDAPASPLLSANQLAALAPAAGEEQPASAVTPAASVETPAAPPAPMAEAPAPAAVETPAPAAAPAAAEAALPAAPAPAAEIHAPSDASVLAGTAMPDSGEDGRLKVGVSPAADSAVLRFPFTERVALATFKRAHALWVVFSKPVAVDLSDFDALPQTVIGKAQLLPNRKVTALRIPMDDGVYIHTAREENSFSWAVLLTSKKQALPTPLRIDINTEPPAPAHVFVPTLQMTEPVTLRDPQVGDRLIITPLYNVGEGVAAPRDFIEFSFLETAQGIAVTKKADEVVVMQLRNGIRVSMPQGATLTRDLPEIKPAEVSTAVSAATLFPYDQWKFNDSNPEAVRLQIQGLFHRVVESTNPQQANEARLQMAKMYLSDGMAVEALALIDGINRTYPSYFKSGKIAALRGAANFLLYRFVEAARDFSAPELNNNKEIEYWRAMLADLLGNSDKSYNYLSLNQDYISKYPPIFRQRLAIVAADRAIDGKEYNTALKIFDKLKQDNIIEPINAYVNFLLAKVSADTGQPKEALEMWDRLAKDFDHPFVQARAEFSRIAWDMDHDAISKDQAIDRLERLRLSWHGDGLELKVLTLLGDLYLGKKDYVNAMRIWNGGVISFPNTGASMDMARKMQEAFITMFNEGIADKLPPLEALALYYEYRNYTPPGSTGNEMIERLADRLVGVDLLDQAASLLDHQMHFQTEKEQRSRIGVKLANVYLLNHQPQKALVALQDSLYGENPLMLRLLRNRLTAQAMIDMGQTDKALATLGSDNSADAERIRMSVYWHERDWTRLVASIEALLKSRPDNTAPITLEESEYLLKLSLAYVFQNNTMQLQYLHDYFGPLMENNPYKPVFDFITGGEMQLTTTNFDDVLTYLSNTQTFIQNYEAHIKTAGLAGVK